MKEEIIKTYYENGNIETERTFVDGVEHGPAKGWFETGELNFEAFKKDGVPHGLVKNYYESGDIYIVGNYKNGKLDGIQKMYFENGQIESRATWKDGKLNGFSERYCENGNLVESLKTREGEVVYAQPLKLDSFEDVLSNGITKKGKEKIENTFNKVEINWIQDLGPIYIRENREPFPFVVFHNPEYEDDPESLEIITIKEVVHPELIIDQIISKNGGVSNYFKQENIVKMSNADYHYCFKGHLFWLGYIDYKDYYCIDIVRMKHEMYSADGSDILYGIHKDSKKINSIIKGLDSLVYNNGEMASGDGRLCYGSSGIVSWWSDPKRLIKRFKNIARNYQDNISVNSFEVELSKYEDLNESELVKNLDDEFFSMKIKTKNFEISVSKGTSSYQMNINILRI